MKTRLEMWPWSMLYISNQNPYWYFFILGAGSRTSTDSFSADSWRAVILIVPVRLGTEHINPIYIPCLKGRSMYGLYGNILQVTHLASTCSFHHPSITRN